MSTSDFPLDSLRAGCLPVFAYLHDWLGGLMVGCRICDQEFRIQLFLGCYQVVTTWASDCLWTDKPLYNQHN